MNVGIEIPRDSGETLRCQGPGPGGRCPFQVWRLWGPPEPAVPCAGRTVTVTGLGRPHLWQVAPGATVCFVAELFTSTWWGWTDTRVA